MACRYLLAVTGWMAVVTAAPAQSWADGLFTEKSYDYGAVPRGPVLTHYFTFTNTTQSPVHVSNVRVSCGCVAAAAPQGDIAPGQTGSIHTTIDTRRFTGSKSVTVFVTFDKPQWAEARVVVNAYGRDDLNLENDTLSFGTVSRGTPAATKTTVTLRQPSWLITQAASASSYVAPEVREVRRTQNEAVYEISANLKPGLPVGQWVTEVTLATNSTYTPTIRLPAMVEVTPALVVSPAEVSLLRTPVGSPAEQKILVRGTQPFRIKEIQGGDASLTASAVSNEARPTHVITVKYDPKQAGNLDRKLRIITDLPGEGVTEVAVKASAIAKQ